MFASVFPLVFIKAAQKGAVLLALSKSPCFSVSKAPAFVDLIIFPLTSRCFYTQTSVCFWTGSCNSVSKKHSTGNKCTWLKPLCTFIQYMQLFYHMHMIQSLHVWNQTLVQTCFLLISFDFWYDRVFRKPSCNRSGFPCLFSGALHPSYYADCTVACLKIAHKWGAAKIGCATSSTVLNQITPILCKT